MIPDVTRKELSKLISYPWTTTTILSPLHCCRHRASSKLVAPGFQTWWTEIQRGSKLQSEILSYTLLQLVENLDPQTIEVAIVHESLENLLWWHRWAHRRWPRVPCLLQHLPLSLSPPALPTTALIMQPKSPSSSSSSATTSKPQKKKEKKNSYRSLHSSHPASRDHWHPVAMPIFSSKAATTPTIANPKKRSTPQNHYPNPSPSWKPHNCISLDIWTQNPPNSTQCQTPQKNWKNSLNTKPP